MTKCWFHYVKALPDLDCVILDGDVMEGEHTTLRSAPDAAETSPLKQVDMAVELLAPLRAKTKKLWLVRGTGFHEGKWNEALERLGEKIDAGTVERQPALGRSAGRRDWRLPLQCRSRRKVPGAIYSGTLMNRTAWFATMAEGLSKTIPADIIIRAHTHATGKGQFFGKWVLSCRAWKLCNPYAIAKMEFYRAQALLDLGGHLLTLSPEGIMWRDYEYQPFKSAHRKLA